MRAQETLVVAGAGGIGLEIARRLGTGARVLLADSNERILSASAEALRNEGFDVTTSPVDISSRASVRALGTAAAEMGVVANVVLTAGISGGDLPHQLVLEVNLVGTAIFLEEFADVIAPHGAGLVIASMSGHLSARLPEDVEYALATAPVDRLLTLPASLAVSDSFTAYRYTKRATQLRVQGASVAWGRRPARLNSISPGVIMSPMTRPALAEKAGGDGIREMIATSSAGRIGTPSDVANVAAFLMSPLSNFITGTDVLMDGGAVAALRYGQSPSETPEEPN